MPHSAKYNRPEEIERQRLKDYQAVFMSEKGQSVLRNIASAVDFFGVPNNLDPQFLAFRAGAHSVVLEILRAINKDPFKLSQEMTDDGRSRNYDD